MRFTRCVVACGGAEQMRFAYSRWRKLQSPRPPRRHDAVASTSTVPLSSRASPGTSESGDGLKSDAIEMIREMLCARGMTNCTRFRATVYVPVLRRGVGCTRMSNLARTKCHARPASAAWCVPVEHELCGSGRAVACARAAGASWVRGDFYRTFHSIFITLPSLELLNHFGASSDELLR